jgi:coatomer protein complex subunit alpha (xenin)
MLTLCAVSSRVDVREQAQKVLQKSEQMARNEHTIDYDERASFAVDCASLTPIYRGATCIKCSYCGSSYAPEHKGKLCLTCNVSQIGIETLGLVTSAGSGAKR